MSDVVKLTVDDREIEVAKGTGLVETAEAAGIEPQDSATAESCLAGKR